jgi:hypothetical protein
MSPDKFLVIVTVLTFAALALLAQIVRALDAGQHDEPLLEDLEEETT